MTALLRKRNGSLVFHDGAKATTLLSRTFDIRSGWR